MQINHKAFVSTLLDFGEAMMKYGAEVSRVEDSLMRICKSYGYKNTQLMAISAGIILTVTLPDGESCSQLRRFYSGGNDFTRLSKLNELSRKTCATPLTEDEFRRALGEITQPDQSCLSVIKKGLGAIFAACGCTVFFGGNLQDCIPTAICALLIFVLDKYLKAKMPNASAYYFVSALLSGLLAVGFCKSLLFNQDMVIIGIIMLLIPGILLTNSMRDMLLGDTLTGSARVFEAILGAACLAAGITVAMLILGGVRI